MGTYFYKEWILQGSELRRMFKKVRVRARVSERPAPRIWNEPIRRDLGSGPAHRPTHANRSPRASWPSRRRVRRGTACTARRRRCASTRPAARCVCARFVSCADDGGGGVTIGTTRSSDIELGPTPSTERALDDLRGRAQRAAGRGRRLLAQPQQLQGQGHGQAALLLPRRPPVRVGSVCVCRA